MKLEVRSVLLLTSNFFKKYPGCYKDLKTENEKDGKANYYLGNILYNKQPAVAKEDLKKAVELSVSNLWANTELQGL